MLERLYDNLEVVDATQPEWQEQLLKLIGYTEPHTSEPLRNIFNVATNLGLRTVVLEKEYIDSHFLDEFQSYYYGRFRMFSSKCDRLHFFQARFTKEKLPRLRLADHGYLGFSIVRPTLSYRTGRTILKSPKDNKDSMYTLCKAEYIANLSGNSLSIKGMPFIQQDSNVSVCAEAALWMTNHYLQRRFSLPCLKPSQITLAATKWLTVGPVRRGLIPMQVLGGLREMGCEPLIFPHYDPDVTARIIYAYVESELPVILLVKVGKGGHAVVIIGHDFNLRAQPLSTWDSNIYWIDHFYINDDAVSPYTELFLRSGQGSGYSIEEHAAYVIVPAPRGISMQADDVFDHVATLREHLNKIVDHFGPNAKPFRFSATELRGLIFRTYLRSCSEFKTGLSPGMNETFRHYYRSMRMPRYIWVTEISKAKYLNKARSRNRRIIGEIIMDSTADRHSAETSYLAIHLLGRLIIRRPEEQEPYTLYYAPHEEPYGHLVR